MEEEFVKSQSKYKTDDEKAEEEKNLIEIIRGDPIKYIILILVLVLQKKSSMKIMLSYHLEEASTMYAY